MAKYCPSCGTQNDDQARFCINCGTGIERNPTNPITQAPVSTSSMGAASHAPPMYADNASMVRTQPIQDPLMASMQKSVGLAVVLSFLIPGLGQIYAGKTGRGLAFLVGFFIGLLFFLPGVIIWIFGMIDANNIAKRYNEFVLTYGRPPQSYEY